MGPHLCFRNGRSNPTNGHRLEGYAGTHAQRANKFSAVNTAGIDHDLIIGSVFFGVGWGLAGLCPDPAIASLNFGGSSGVVFANAMIIGMLSTRRLQAFFL